MNLSMAKLSVRQGERSIGILSRFRGVLCGMVCALVAFGLATSPAHAIANGSSVPDGKYPFAVSIHTGSVPTNSNERCSGSHIAPEWVLTAQHCFDTTLDGTVDFPATSVWVSLDRTRISDTSRGEVIQGAAVMLYNTNDVALLRLAKPSKAPTVALAQSAPAWPMTVTVAGWGRTQSGTTPDNQQEGAFALTPTTNPLDLFYDGFNDTDTCEGDSGSPVIVQGGGVTALVAVHTNGSRPCGSSPGVVVGSRVDQAYKWIRDTVADGDLVSVKMNGTASGVTEVHVLDRGAAAGAYKAFQLQRGIQVEPSNQSYYRFLRGDYNNDGTRDLFVIKMQGATSTEVHVLDGRTNFQTFLLHTGTALHKTDATQFQFGLGDFDRDGKLDVYAIKMNGTGSGRTEVHVLNGASNYSSFLLQAGTALPSTSASQFQFAIGDYDRDGRPDLYAIKMNGTGSGRTEVHVLNGASNYSSFLLHIATALHETLSSQFAFAIGDFNLDNRPDVYAVKMNGSITGKTEVHVLNGEGNYTSFALQTTTALNTTLPSQFQFTTS